MSKFLTINARDKEYTLKLTARGCIKLEEKLNKNPIAVFSSLKDGELPKFTDIITLIDISIQEPHTLEDTCDILDEYIDINGIVGLYKLTINILSASGFTGNSKN